MQIVIAWAEKTKLVPTGRHVKRDMNWFPEFSTEYEGKACMWRRKGTDKDLKNANDYANDNGQLVFCFPPNEKDPLGRARDLAVKAALRK